RLLEKHPDLTGREQKLCAYLRTDMSSKEISSLMNISVRSVENNRYKLREKLKLDRKENLKDFIMNIKHFINNRVISHVSLTFPLTSVLKKSFFIPLEIK